MYSESRAGWLRRLQWCSVTSRVRSKSRRYLITLVDPTYRSQTRCRSVDRGITGHQVCKGEATMVVSPAEIRIISSGSQRPRNDMSSIFSSTYIQLRRRISAIKLWMERARRDGRRCRKTIARHCGSLLPSQSETARCYIVHRLSCVAAEITYDHRRPKQF